MTGVRVDITWLRYLKFKQEDESYEVTLLSSDKTLKKKILVWHSHNFLLPYNTVEECFIIGITFTFNLYFLCFVVDELPASIIIVYNF